jgi:rubrerythrin
VKVFAVGKTRDPKNITNNIKSLSVLESKTAVLYNLLSEKVELPLIKSLLKEISLDSKKHSTILYGVAKSLPETDWKPKDSKKTLGNVLLAVEKFTEDLSKIRSLTASNLAELSKQLAIFESTMGEEYFVFVQLKTLQFMSKEIGKIYNINLDSVKDIFTEIMNDEEHHREVLATIKELIQKSEDQEEDNMPMVRFLNPDAWIAPSTPNQP